MAQGNNIIFIHLRAIFLMTQKLPLGLIVSVKPFIVKQVII